MIKYVDLLTPWWHKACSFSANLLTRRENNKININPEGLPEARLHVRPSIAFTQIDRQRIIMGVQHAQQARNVHQGVIICDHIPSATRPGAVQIPPTGQEMRWTNKLLPWIPYINCLT